ncbi:MAG: general stress protein, partial [Burkholderiaceae bacterium]
MAKTIVGSFDSFEEAQEVLRDLQQKGFSRDDISVIANNATGKYSSQSAGVAQSRADTGTTVSDTGAATATGAAAGGVLGGAAGLVVGLMGLAIPGIGPIVAAGPIAAALAGAGVGAVAGGLIGGLTGVGVSEDDASYYAESVRRGGALVTVRADDSRADEAASAMRSHGAVDIESRVEQWKQQGWTGHDPS